MNPTTPVIAIIGPSGAGKSSAVRGLQRRGLIHINPTWTTRPPRQDERDGCVEHRFVSEAIFDELEHHGFFLEVAAWPGLGYRYGLPPLDESASERTPVVMARAPFVERLRVHFPGLCVYHVDDTADRTRARLLARDLSADETLARLRDNRRETIVGRALADRVFPNDTTIDDLVDRMALAICVDTIATSPVGAR